jgi:pimeloyl-ACP methyl ester carboxylesterase
MRAALPVVLLAATIAPLPGGRAADPAPSAVPPPEELRLETTEGIRISAWYYAPVAGAKPPATVILVHDLEGSHKTVEPLALSLQGAGYAVVAPDLRGHGASVARPAPVAGGRLESFEPRMLKKSDLESIAAATGGSLREQAASRGEIETVRSWIRVKSQAGELDLDKLCVVGSGAGAVLASLWTAADSNWPPIASGPQGGQVRALVLISPPWSTKGVSFTVPLSQESLQRRIPVLVLGGKGDRDAVRLFDQFKRLRPAEWFQQRAGQDPEKAKDLADATQGSAFFIQADTSLSADKLVSEPEIKLAEQIKTFLGIALAKSRP